MEPGPDASVPSAVPTPSGDAPRPPAPLTRRELRARERAAQEAPADDAVTTDATATDATAVDDAAAVDSIASDAASAPAAPVALPSRRSVRSSGRTPSSARRRTDARALATRRTAARGALPTSFTRLRDNAATAGVVLASAGLLMGAVAPSATSAPAPAGGAEAAVASGVPQAVTAPAGATVTFGLEAAGPAAEGIAPSIASARALSASLAPAAKERKAFSAPVENPEVASTFGYRVNPLGGSGTELHTGVDYASACGTPVKAADAGTVVDSGWHAYGGGQRILIDHGDGLKTTYNHLSALDVPAGTTVKRGDLLGAVGSTGNSTGCHLHFEVMVNDEKVDPQPWL